MQALPGAALNGIRIDETLEAILAPTHDQWIEEVRRQLLPVTTRGAAHWDRWWTVRYLNEGFLGRFRVECTLLRELKPLVTGHEAHMLEAGGEEVARLHLALERISRGYPTAAEFAATSAEFLRALELWCAEVELSCTSIPLSALPAEARRALKQLDAPGRALVGAR
jgi:hypothetical protein